MKIKTNSANAGRSQDMRAPMLDKMSQAPSKGRLAAAVALSGLLLSVAQPATPQSRAQESATITPNYKDADLSQIIQAVSEVTGKNFIIDPRVNAKVTMLSATPMSPAAFYEAFLAVLQVYGYVAVPAGRVIKIVPNTDARQMPSIDLPRDVSSTSDEIVTQIITLKSINAGALVPILRPLVPPYGALAAYPAGNILIISDRASNVNRLVRIIQRMDEAGDEPFEVLALHNAGAGEVVRIVNALNTGAGADAGGALAKVVADERTNSVILSGERGQRLRLKALIFNMDTPSATGGDIQVRYLRYADAEKIADKLKGQATATAKAQGGPAASASVQGAQGGSANIDASVTIWADVPTNALIITAPPKIMKSLMEVIDKIDIRRAQVQVEAIIVEIDVNKSSNLGVQWLLFGRGDTVPAGVVNLPGSGTSIVDLAALALSGGTVGSSTTTPGVPGVPAISSSTVGTGATIGVGRLASTGVSFAALVQALRSDGSSNIISTPSLITMNNEQAEVKVTQEIPLITGSFANTTASVSGTSSPFQTIQREEVGTILKVTPHINEGNSVQLKIEQEDSSPGAKLTDSADISTNKRSIKTTVLIEDGGIIVLGGLISDSVTESEDRVPGLGAIPIIGNLFKSRSGSRQKKNLMVFIRPKIMRDADATESTSEAAYNTVRQSQRNLNGGHVTLLPGQKQPAVPAIPSGIALPPPPPPSETNPVGATPNPPVPFSSPLPQSVPPGTATPAPTTPPPSAPAPPAAPP
ncbi:MAG TPA: type II secretion system secretin GspD [Steroidobacteraceae bacterium]|nr:type II secretion system secretin GspD [Steroidobacteraceae bacterium]